MRSKVFVVQENTKKNYSAARDFGELFFLTDREYPRDERSLSVSKIPEEIKTGLRDYDPDRDYIMLTGHPLTVSIAFNMALFSAKKCNVDNIKLLTWEANRAQYNVYRFSTRFLV